MTGITLNLWVQMRHLVQYKQAQLQQLLVRSLTYILASVLHVRRTCDCPLRTLTSLDIRHPSTSTDAHAPPEDGFDHADAPDGIVSM